MRVGVFFCLFITVWYIDKLQYGEKSVGNDGRFLPELGGIVSDPSESSKSLGMESQFAIQKMSQISQHYFVMVKLSSTLTTKSWLCMG